MRITKALQRKQVAGATGQANTIAVTQATAALGPGANNGTAVDGATWFGAGSVVIVRGANTGGITLVTVKVQESANGVSGFTDCMANQTITTAATVYRFSFPKTKRYLRTVITVSGGGGDTATTTAYLEAVGGSIFTPVVDKIGLYVDVDDKGLDTLYTDLTLPTGSMATQNALAAFNRQFYKPDGNLAQRSTVLQWGPAGAGEDVVCQGWYLMEAGASNILLGWQSFPEPVPFAEGQGVLRLVMESIALNLEPSLYAVQF